MKISRIKWFAPKRGYYIPQFWPPHPPYPQGYPPKPRRPAYIAAAADQYEYQDDVVINEYVNIINDVQPIEINEYNVHSLPNIAQQNYFSDFDARCHSEPQNPETTGANVNRTTALANSDTNAGNISNDWEAIPYFSDSNFNEMVSCQPSSSKIKRIQNSSSQESLFHFSQSFEDEFAEYDDATLAQNVSLQNIPSFLSQQNKRKRGRKGYSTLEEKEAAKRKSCKKYYEKRKTAFQELEKSVTNLKRKHQNLIKYLQQIKNLQNYNVHELTFTPIPPLSKPPNETKCGSVKRCRDNREIKFQNLENEKIFFEEEIQNLEKDIQKAVSTVNTAL